MKQRQLRSLTAGLIGVLLLVAAGWGLWNHQSIADWLRASQFEPSSAVAQLAHDTTMTDYGQRLLYASEPQLQPADQFNQSCADVEKGSAVIGCYVDRRIYIYNIDNKELSGIEEVTAAHEMLHAAYDRLSSRERREVNNLLNQAALSLRADKTFTERLEAYQFADSDEKHNELHSIIGTEIADIDPKLETYYARYFHDRAAVVALHSQYVEVFERYTDQARELASQLDALAARINADTADYERRSNQLREDVDDFNRRSGIRGAFQSQSEFELARNQLLFRQDQLSAERQSIIEQRSSYNELLQQYNQVALHLASLSNSIDSRLAPAPEVR